MDQRIAIGAGVVPGRPIHRACVVTGCWCGSSTADARSARTATRIPDRRTFRSLESSSIGLTNIALRSVGLPVV